MDGDKTRHDLENDVTAFERRLAVWRPAAGVLNRDQMLFDAGRAAALAEGRSRFWQVATAASALLSLTFGGLLADERARRVALESKTVTSTALRDPDPSSRAAVQLARLEPAERNSYFALTAQLARGARDLSSLEVELESEPVRRPPAAPSNSAPTLVPPRAVDLDRVLDL